MAGLCYLIFNNKIYMVSGETSNKYSFGGELFKNHSDMFLTGTINNL